MFHINFTTENLPSDISRDLVVPRFTALHVQSILKLA